MADSTPVPTKKRKRKRRASTATTKLSSPAVEPAPSEGTSSLTSSIAWHDLQTRVDLQSIPPLPPHSDVNKRRRQSKLAAKDSSILTPGPPSSSLPSHDVSRPSTGDMSSDHLQRFMSSPGPPPTSVPKVVGPEKEDVSMRNGSSSSSDDEESSSHESGSAKSTSDEQNGGESKENEATNDGSNAINDTPSDAKDNTKTPSSDQGTYLYLILLLT